MIPDILYKLLYKGIRTAQLSGPARYRLQCRRGALRLERWRHPNLAGLVS